MIDGTHRRHMLCTPTSEPVRTDVCDTGAGQAAPAEGVEQTQTTSARRLGTPVGQGAVCGLIGRVGGCTGYMTNDANASVIGVRVPPNCCATMAVYAAQRGHSSCTRGYTHPCTNTRNTLSRIPSVLAPANRKPWDDRKSRSFTLERSVFLENPIVQG